MRLALYSRMDRKLRKSRAIKNGSRLQCGVGSRCFGAARNVFRATRVYNAIRPSTCLAKRLRATCKRRLIVPTGASNSSAISTSDLPLT